MIVRAIVFFPLLPAFLFVFQIGGAMQIITLSEWSALYCCFNLFDVARRLSFFIHAKQKMSDFFGFLFGVRYPFWGIK